jgi:hypothetical protein
VEEIVFLSDFDVDSFLVDLGDLNADIFWVAVGSVEGGIVPGDVKAKVLMRNDGVLHDLKKIYGGKSFSVDLLSNKSYHQI